MESMDKKEMKFLGEGKNWGVAASLWVYFNEELKKKDAENTDEKIEIETITTNCVIPNGPSNIWLISDEIN